MMDMFLKHRPSTSSQPFHRYPQHRLQDRSKLVSNALLQLSNTGGKRQRNNSLDNRIAIIHKGSGMGIAQTMGHFLIETKVNASEVTPTRRFASFTRSNYSLQKIVRRESKSISFSFCAIIMEI